MHGPQILAFLIALPLAAQNVPQAYLKAGERAFELTEKAVAFGPRPAGSPAQMRQQRWIVEELTRAGCDVQQIAFQADTPRGRKAMKNIICRFSGESNRAVVLSGHYDTYSRPGLEFVGANDGGSSTGLLLAMAQRLTGRKLADPVWLVFFDGEESVVEWSGDDHTYGSRKLAELWLRDGTKERVKALINVDMIGDADLNIVYEGYSTGWLRDLIFDVAQRLGYVEEFPMGAAGYVADDHEEFLRRGFPAVDLIDFEYGFFNRLWHSESDVMTHLSPRSFGVMIHVLEESLKELELRP